MPAWLPLLRSESGPLRAKPVPALAVTPALDPPGHNLFAHPSFYLQPILRAAGVDLVTLATLLGHSGIKMVMRYAHPTEEHQFEAMRKHQRYMTKKARR